MFCKGVVCFISFFRAVYFLIMYHPPFSNYPRKKSPILSIGADVFRATCKLSLRLIMSFVTFDLRFLVDLQGVIYSILSRYLLSDHASPCRYVL